MNCFVPRQFSIQFHFLLNTIELNDMVVRDLSPPQFSDSRLAFANFVLGFTP